MSVEQVQRCDHAFCATAGDQHWTQHLDQSHWSIRTGAEELAEQGLITLRSVHSVQDTIDHLTSAAEQAGMVIFARVDHCANAVAEGLELRPTQLLIFGHARGGTPLMQQDQRAGIDLPLKALAWQDADDTVWLSYNDARWIAERHDLGETSASDVAAIRAGMEKLTAFATN